MSDLFANKEAVIKDKHIQIRVTQQQKEALTARAKEKGFNYVSDYIFSLVHDDMNNK